MNARAVYADIAREVAAELAARIAAAERAGIAREAIAIDPGIGFAKLAPHSLELLRRLPRAGRLWAGPSWSASRASPSSAASAANPTRSAGCPARSPPACSRCRAAPHILRVHDVAETVQALKLWHSADRPGLTQRFPDRLAAGLHRCRISPNGDPDDQTPDACSAPTASAARPTPTR